MQLEYKNMNERILLIDDHTLFRAGLRDLLTRRKIEVVADGTVNRQKSLH